MLILQLNFMNAQKDNGDVEEEVEEVNGKAEDVQRWGFRMYLK